MTGTGFAAVPGRRAARIVTAVVALAVVTACGPAVSTTITTHHTLPERSERTTYAFMPLKDQAAMSENRVYRKRISEELLRHGFVETDMENAEFVVSFSHGIDNGKERLERSFFSTTSMTEYRRGLWVYLFDNASVRSGSPQARYEGTVTSAGALNDLADILPGMIGALFRDFPGRPGTRRMVQLKP